MDGKSVFFLGGGGPVVKSVHVPVLPSVGLLGFKVLSSKEPENMFLILVSIATFLFRFLYFEYFCLSVNKCYIPDNPRSKCWLAPCQLHE